MLDRVREVGKAIRTCCWTLGGRIIGLDGEASEAFEILESRTLFSGSAGLGNLPPVAPSAVDAVAVSPTSVKITWSTAGTNAGGYHVWRSTDGLNYTKIITLTGGATARYTDSTAAANRDYWYHVRSFKSTLVSSPSDADAVTTPLIAPGAFSATAQGSEAVLVKWKRTDLAATNYLVLRSTDGVNYSLLSDVAGGTTVSYLDQSVESGTAYWYKAQSAGDDNTSLFTAAVKASTKLTTPTDLAADAAAKSVSLTWAGVDPHAASTLVLRAKDGITFTTLATLSPGVTQYTDNSVATGTKYQYRVRVAKSGVPSGNSALLPVTTLLLAPTSLAAAAAGPDVMLTWSDANRSGMGYRVFRSGDGENFTQIAQLAAGSEKKFKDKAVAPDTAYTYRVAAFAGAIVSPVSGTVVFTTPRGTENVTITTRHGDSELLVTTYGVTGSIAVAQSGSTVTITINGQAFEADAPSTGLFIHDRAGTSTISIGDVQVRTTVTSVGGAVATAVVSADDDVYAWLDSTDSFSGEGSSHKIAKFAGGVTKALGAALANPKDSGATVKLAASMFGSGPLADDINQGGVGDCYFLASLAAFAQTNPGVILDSAVDLGDGTYVVEYHRNNAPVYVRVSNAFSTGPYWGYKFARPGDSGTLWALAMEKAFAYFRTGANTYASISAGWMSEVYTALGVGYANFSLSGTENNFFAMISGSLATGKAVTLGTSSTAPNLVGGHAYTLMSVSVGHDGLTRYTLRNPWGVSGTSMEDGDGYVTLTFNQMKANFVMGTRAA